MGIVGEKSAFIGEYAGKPVVFIHVAIERRFFFHAVMMEHLPDVALLSRGDEDGTPAGAVVLGVAVIVVQVVGYLLRFFVRQVVQQAGHAFGVA